MTDVPGESKGGKPCPPKEGQFRAGVSGNPGGRPKGSRNLRTDLAQMMKRPIAIQEAGKRKRVSRQEAMLQTLLHKALSGDMRAISSLMNTLLKLEPTSEQSVREVVLSQVDAEIIADFLRRNQPSAS